MYTKLINLLESQLGSCYPPKQGQKPDAKFNCPLCHHYKKKLYVNLENGWWHCWVCESKSKNPRKLLNLIDTPLSVKTDILSHWKGNNSTTTSELLFGDGIGKMDINTLFGDNDTKEEKINIQLPPEFKPLYIYRKNDIGYNKALYYATKKRKLTFKEIIRYNIGYCDSGKFRDRLIIPSYDKDNKLNYFEARAIFDNTNLKYMKPILSKNIIGLENHINWEFPIVLVEGIFDAVGVGTNAIPLLGKTISEKLKIRLMSPDVSTVFLGLDKDAFLQAINIIEYLLTLPGKEIFLIEYDDNKDFGDMTKTEASSCIRNAKQIQYEDIIKLKMIS